jgi:AcrR family transcriptional regulator
VITGTLALVRPRRYRGVDDGERRAERRRRLVEAGLELFGTLGYQAASVRQICAAAGLTERYFYESFPHREDLLTAVYGHIVAALRQGMSDAMDAAPVGAVAKGAAALDVYFSYIEANRPAGRVLLFEILGVSPAIDRVYNQGMDGLARMLSRAAFGEGAPAADGSLFGLGVAGAVVAIAVHWILTGYSRDRAEIVAHCTALLAALADRPQIPPSAGTARESTS